MASHCRVLVVIRRKLNPLFASYLQKGDLVFYDTDYDRIVNHVGIYESSNKMINATSSKGVSDTDTNNSYWKPRYVSP
ncbi:C40 family peptidase [Priestia sp. SIMBA_032]|uniref:C40 family peptidase n=1 Tax=Priestia sp. SIMBA_032 TaxID=3085775 RepID=UPI00397DFC1F